MSLIHKMLRPFQYHHGLDLLLAQAPPETTDLRERLDWVGRLVNWVRTAGPKRTEMSLESRLKTPERIQTARLKYVLQILERDAGLKSRVTETLQSMLRDTRALELFMHVGVPNQQGFIGEFLERLNLLLLPQAPHDEDLISVFSETFRFESDAEWIRYMDPQLFEQWIDLFSFSEAPHKPRRNNLIRDAQDALLLLSDTVRTIGLSRLIRNRVAEKDFRKTPFFSLTDRAEAFLHSKDEERVLIYEAFNQNLLACFVTLEEVQLFLRNQGASIELVYQLGRLKALMRRMDTLARLLAHRENEPRFIQDFLSLLVQENIRARKINKLLKDNLVLLCQKIVEVNAETGEHYITRDRNEHWEILKKSWGGGILTGVTTFFKFILGHLSAPPFVSGIFAFSNYAISFLALQALGFTLATKQPAMTATALAAKIEETTEATDDASDVSEDLGKQAQSISPLVEEIIHLVRSQLTAVIGNILGVVPMVILIDLVFSAFGSHLTDAKHAEHTIESFSLLGVTPFYAAGTGVLLWLSSIFSGWFGNWFSFRGLPEAIEHHHRLRYVLGAERTQVFAMFLKRNVGAIASNLSLAFLLAMTPQFASFFGLPFDVRHVTLSSGALTASSMAIGASVFATWSFWLAVGGVISMAILNLSVAFSLALVVAIWAKKVSAPKRSVIYRALLKSFLSNPWVFIMPPRAEPTKQ